LLFFIHNNPAITISSLLPPHNFEHPAIMTAMNINVSLHLTVELLSTGTKQVDPTNSKLHLIVAFIRRASTAQTNVDLISVSEGKDQHQVTPATICNDSFKLIDTLSSEEATLCSEGAQPAPTIYATNLAGAG